MRGSSPALRRRATRPPKKSLLLMAEEENVFCANETSRGCVSLGHHDAHSSKASSEVGLSRVGRSSTVHRVFPKKKEKFVERKRARKGNTLRTIFDGKGYIIFQGRIKSACNSLLKRQQNTHTMRAHTRTHAHKQSASPPLCALSPFLFSLCCVFFLHCIALLYYIKKTAKQQQRGRRR